jgi:archaemetzincin
VRTHLPLFTLLAVTLVACNAPAPHPAAPESPHDVPAEVGPAALARAAVEDSDGFTLLSEPRPGEWRARFDEPHVTFEQYVESGPVRADDERRVLAFVPAGEFGPVESAVMEATTRFCGIWFELSTRQLPPLVTPGADDGLVRTMHNAFTGSEETQIHTAWFLRQQLPRRLPDDAVTLTAVTMTDLYPGEGWNYVFGEALLQGRVGVYSLRRHFPDFWGEPDTQEARVQALRRSLKLVTHEVGHAFGLEHCVRYRCSMNGSNSLEESDGAPLHLCPDCLEKLRWNRGFDVLERYARLEEFFATHSLAEEAAWVRARIARIREVAASAPR